MEKELNIERNVPLASYTTFGIGGPAEYFTTIKEEDALGEAVRFAKERGLQITVLGGGSNMLVADEGVKGLVIKNEIGGIAYEENDDTVLVTAGAGVSWDALVAETVAKGFWGIENLSGIPGTVGATPIQNVGAYGVEIADVISSVHVFNIDTEQHETLKGDTCAFTYRHSIFKTEEGKCYIVIKVVYELSRTPAPKLGYKDLDARFHGAQPLLTEIRDAIITIRSSKFPDWHETGTAGSFFKNPIVTPRAYDALVQKYPGIPAFFTEAGMVKVPLGWILEHILNLKGVQSGNVGTYRGQALVVVNYGGATAAEIDAFANTVVQKVFDMTDIVVEREVTNIA